MILLKEMINEMFRKILRDKIMTNYYTKIPIKGSKVERGGGEGWDDSVPEVLPVQV